MSIRKIVVLVILIALAVWIGLRAKSNIEAKKREAARPAPELIIPVETAQPGRQTIEEKIRAAGSLLSDAEISIFSKVPGKIANNLVRMGSPVRPGQTVSIVNRDEVGYDYKPYEVKSDAKGVVVRVLLNPGASVNPNAPILNLVDIDTVKVAAAVDEKKIRFILTGQSARVTLEAFPGETFTARVSTISPVANPVSRTIDVELTIPNPSHRLKPGMSAEVEWTESRRTAMVVPLVSVVDRGGRKNVFLARDGRAQMVPVTVGAVVGDAIEILSGLRGGETLITTGAGQLNDQDKIRFVENPPARN